jgi:hypothetical protein
MKKELKLVSKDQQIHIADLLKRNLERIEFERHLKQFEFFWVFTAKY